MYTTYTRMRTIDLVLHDLCAHGAGALIEDAVRAIAARIGRSAGAISPALRRLEQDGWIARLSDGRGTLIEVLRSDQESDRVTAEQMCDQESDRSMLPVSAPVAPPIAPAPDETPQVSDQNSDRMTAEHVSDQVSDRSAAMVDHVLNTQQQPHARARVFDTGKPSNGGTPDRGSPDRVFPAQWRKILDANPGYTAADFDRDLAAAERRSDVRDPIRFVAGLRADGQSILSPEELHDRTERRDRTASRRPRQDNAPNQSRRWANSAAATRPPPLTRAEFQALPTRGELRRLHELSGLGAAAGG